MNHVALAIIALGAPCHYLTNDRWDSRNRVANAREDRIRLNADAPVKTAGNVGYTQAQLVAAFRHDLRFLSLGHNLLAPNRHGPRAGDETMGLQTTGEIVVAVDRDSAFRYVEVPEQLAQCIPGCSELREVSPGRFTAVLTNQLSFMTLKFHVVVQVVKVDPPHSIEAKITGKPIGFVGLLSATAGLQLSEAGLGRTLIRHSSDVGLTGKLGGLGQPVFRAKSAEMSAKFGANLKVALERNASGKNGAGDGKA